MYTSIKGTEEYLFDDALLYHYIESEARKLFTLYNYSEVILPILENIKVFLRGVGDTADIVTKQMYRIHQKEDIVLRPEGTSQVVRSFIQNNLDARKEFVKFFYVAPMFRGENPQKGRLREFHHIGVESLGSDSPYIDAEMLELGYTFLTQYLHISDFSLCINSLGCENDKKRFSEIIHQRLQDQKNDLCETCRNRLSANPLRVLDCKNPECKKIITESATDPKDYLCRGCMDFFNRVLSLLDLQRIPYTVKNTLVRGLDYYTGTVFEFTTTKLGAQDALGAGGRYDGLVSMMGGQPTPACGFAFGIERLLLMLKSTVTLSKKPCVFIAPLGADSCTAAFALLNILRAESIAADMDYSGKSLKAQLRYSQRINARIVIIIGEEERASNIYTVKNMLTGDQIKVSLQELPAKTKEILNNCGF